MKRVFFLSTAFAALALSACDSPTEPAVERRAFAILENTTVPIPATLLPNSCTGEFVHLEGTMHVKSGGNTDGSGGQHILEFSMSNLKGFGVTTMAKYVAKSSTSWVMNVPEPAGESTERMSLRMVRQGEEATLLGDGDDFFFSWLVHVTVNANGVMTAMVDNLKMDECH